MRKLKRNIIRNKVGNRTLKEAWKLLQKRKYKEDYGKVCLYNQRRK